MLNSFNSSFDNHLMQPKNLKLLYNCVNDPNDKIKE